MATKTNKDKKELDISKFTFLRDFLLVKPLRPESKNGLVDPAQYEDKAEFGEVLETGDMVTNLKKGDVIRFGKYASELLRSGGQDYFIIHEEDVSARL